jgi:hypothetical protein
MKNRILSVLLLVVPVLSIFAQVPPPPDYGEDAGTPGAGETPIDQYVVFLAIAILVFGSFYIWNQRKLVKN